MRRFDLQGAIRFYRQGCICQQRDFTYTLDIRDMSRKIPVVVANYSIAARISHFQKKKKNKKQSDSCLSIWVSRKISNCGRS